MVTAKSADAPDWPLAGIGPPAASPDPTGLAAEVQGLAASPSGRWPTSGPKTWSPARSAMAIASEDEEGREALAEEEE